MNKMKRTIKMLALLASIIMSCGPSDNLLQVCYDGNQARYSGCESTKPLIWRKESLPIKYWIEPSLALFDESIDAAAKMWNDETCTLLVRVDEKEDAQVFIFYMGWYSGYVIADESLANVSHFGDGEYATSAIMRFNDTTDVHTFFHWATHEFGHVIGLGHDHHSIMRPELPEMIDNIARPLPSDGDIRLIKKLYCK